MKSWCISWKRWISIYPCFGFVVRKNPELRLLLLHRFENYEPHNVVSSNHKCWQQLLCEILPCYWGTVHEWKPRIRWWMFPQVQVIMQSLTWTNKRFTSIFFCGWYCPFIFYCISSNHEDHFSKSRYGKKAWWSKIYVILTTVKKNLVSDEVDWSQVFLNFIST